MARYIFHRNVIQGARSWRINNERRGSCQMLRNSLVAQFSTNDKGRDEINSTKLPIKCLRFATKVYDFLTFPIYTIVQKPGKKLARHNAVKAVRNPEGNEWTSIIPRCVISEKMERLGIDTLDKLFDHAMARYGGQKCLGTRPILSENQIEVSGQQIKQLELGDFQWKSYSEVNDLTQKLSIKMKTRLGLKDREAIAIFADSRQEWLMSAFSAFKANLAIVTIFTALGDDAVVHCANETEIKTLFTSEDLMPRCYQLLKQMPLVRNVVYMDKTGTTFKLDRSQIPPSMNVQPLSSFFTCEPTSSQDEISAPTTKRPSPNDTAIIMYTSGSTGMPKGVILSHMNAISVIKGVADAIGNDHLPRDDEKFNTYLAFLPMAHILELIAEAMCLLQGLAIGYGSPLTLTDMSPGLKKGSKGDATLLKPTMMAAVPLILERVGKAVQANLKARGGLLPDLFDFFCNYKMTWVRKGYETPLLDALFFQKIRNLLGGRIRLIFCGGSTLSSHTEELVRSILCTCLVIGYGLTETAGHDLSVGRSGSPIRGCTFRLVDWEEGGYRVNDKPYPRGELYVGGESVALGYLKKADSEDFFVENGLRWIKTGDVAEFHEDGVVRIIDRKKDLVKLADGEFISLGKIESILKTSSLIDNVCAFANSSLVSPVAIVIPSRVEVETMGKMLGKVGRFEELTQDGKIVEMILEKIQEHGRECALTKSEIPRAVYLTPDLWTPQNELVTSSLKLKRVNIQKQFQSQLNQLILKAKCF